MSTWRADSLGLGHNVWQEIATRLILISSFIITEDVRPFWRIIQQEEVWLYKYPNTTGYVTTAALYGLVISLTLATIGFFFILNKNVREAWEALLVPSLSLPLTGTLTNFIKIPVGRPRPDYYARCLPGVSVIDVTAPCTGKLDFILEGRKSFPSGHSSIAFCAMGFISFYISGKIGTFQSSSRSESWKIIPSLAPLVCALLISISRTCDYHHHWQDVVIGSILGLSVSYFIYRRYFPSFFSHNSHLSHAVLEESYVENKGAPSTSQG